MKRSIMMFAGGLAAMFLVSLATQSASADSYCITSYSSDPFVTERVFESPVMIDPATTTTTTRVIESPVVLDQRPDVIYKQDSWSSHHLFNVRVPFFHMNMF